MQEKDSYMNQWNDWRSNRLHRNTSHRRLRSHSRAHIDLFLELNLLRSTIVRNNAIQRAAPSSPPKNAILFVVFPAKTCVYSSKFLASCIHKLEFKFSWSKFSWMETWMQNLYRVYRALVTVSSHRSATSYTNVLSSRDRLSLFRRSLGSLELISSNTY